MVDSPDIIPLLMQLGLSEYEGKAYVALLQLGSGNAYEIAKASGIPTSKIYETVKRLTEKELFLPLSKEEIRGRKYTAQDPNEFLLKKTKETGDIAGRVRPMLHQVMVAYQSEDYVWPLTSEQSIVDKARDIVESSQDYVMAFLWPKELEWLLDALYRAELNQARIAMLYYGVPDVAVGAAHHYPVREQLLLEKSEREMVLVVDKEVALWSYVTESNAVHGFWTNNSALVTMADEYIRHGIYISKLLKYLDNTIKKRFGDNYEKLLDVFSDG